MKGVAIAAYSLAVIRELNENSTDALQARTLTSDPVVIAHNKYSLWLTNVFGGLKIITLIL